MLTIFDILIEYIKLYSVHNILSTFSFQTNNNNDLAVLISDFNTCGFLKEFGNPNFFTSNKQIKFNAKNNHNHILK